MAKRPTVEPRPATFSPEEMSKITSDLQAELAALNAVPVKAVGALRLFHKSQTRPLTKEEAGEFAKKFAERAAADKAKIVSIAEAGAQQ
jgi:hypothetical protein